MDGECEAPDGKRVPRGPWERASGQGHSEHRTRVVRMYIVQADSARVSQLATGPRAAALRRAAERRARTERTGARGAAVRPPGRPGAGC